MRILSVISQWLWLCARYFLQNAPERYHLPSPASVHLSDCDSKSGIGSSSDVYCRPILFRFSCEGAGLVPTKWSNWICWNLHSFKRYLRHTPLSCLKSVKSRNAGAGLPYALWRTVSSSMVQQTLLNFATCKVTWQVHSMAKMSSCQLYFQVKGYQVNRNPI